MDTKKITRDLRMRNWMQIIEQCQASGLTTKDFCAQHSIKTKQYYYWQHKIRIHFAGEHPLATTENPTPTWVPLSSATPVPDSITVRYGAFSLEITEHTSESLLQKTLQLLQKINV